MVVRKVPGENFAQVALAKDNHVVEAVPTNRADEPLEYGFCQGARGAMTTSSIPILTNPAPEPLVVDRVSVPEEKPGSLIEGERFDDLLGGPRPEGLP